MYVSKSTLIITLGEGDNVAFGTDEIQISKSEESTGILTRSLVPYI